MPGTFKKGDKVSWPYRGAIGHGTVVGVATKGNTPATTRYKVREHDHHPGEKDILIHTGKALRHA